MSTVGPSARDEWKDHWGLVLSASVGFGFFSIMAAATGLFMEPLGKEFGWSRALLSSGLSISAAVVVVLSPFFGILIDRWGTRRIAIPGLFLVMIAMISFSLIDGSVEQWIGLWIFYALASLAVKSTVWTTAVASVFTAGRGLAIGVTLSGTALAQMIVPPIGNALIEAFGWRAAFVWIALGWGGIAIVLCFLFLRDGHDLNRARAKAAPDGSYVPSILSGLSVAEAWRSTALWRLAVSTFFLMTLTIAVMVHQFPLLTEAGVSRTDAALLAGLAGAAGIAGKLVTGWLLDRYPANLVGGITLGSTSIAFLLLLEPFRTMPLIVAAMLINGYGAGTKLQICGYLTTRYAGLKNFGKIFGAMASVIALGSGLGPVLGGLIHDLYGSYTPLLLAGIVGCLFSGFLILGLGPYPRWDTAEAEPQAA